MLAILAACPGLCRPAKAINLNEFFAVDNYVGWLLAILSSASACRLTSRRHVQVERTQCNGYP